jgi:undecaprenyl-diphosphatase
VLRIAARYGPRAVLGGAALFALAVPFGLLLLLVEARWAPLRRLDEGARDILHGYAVGHPGYVLVLKALSFGGSTQVYLPLLALTAVVLVVFRRSRLAVFALVTYVGGGVINPAAKGMIGRARPVLPDPVSHAGGWSFPSGHAQAAVVTALVMLIVLLPVLPRVLGRIAIGGAITVVLGIGFSRIGLGVHYVSDVLAGYALGAAWVAVSAACFGVWRPGR